MAVSIAVQGGRSAFARPRALLVGRLLRGLLYYAAFVGFAGAVANLDLATLSDKFWTHEIDPQRLLLNNLQMRILAQLHASAWMVCLPMGCYWLRSCRLAVDHVAGQRFGTWAFLWCFVPVMNLIQPIRIVRDLYAAAAGGAPMPRRFAWWWATSLAMLAVQLFAWLSLLRGGGDLGSLTHVAYLRVAGYALFFASSVLGAAVVRKVGAVLRAPSTA